MWARVLGGGGGGDAPRHRGTTPGSSTCLLVVPGLLVPLGYLNLLLWARGPGHMPGVEVWGQSFPGQPTARPPSLLARLSPPPGGSCVQGKLGAPLASPEQELVQCRSYFRAGLARAPAERDRVSGSPAACAGRRALGPGPLASRVRNAGCPFREPGGPEVQEADGGLGNSSRPGWRGRKALTCVRGVPDLLLCTREHSLSIRNPRGRLFPASAPEETGQRSRKRFRRWWAGPAS